MRRAGDEAQAARGACGTSAQGFLWILARDTCLPADVYAGLVSQARCLGFEVDRLVTR